MRGRRGFTIIEFLILLAFIGILAVVVIGVLAGTAAQGNNLSFGFNGITETRCINGYTFVVGRDGNARQVLDEFGKGARCK
jgi:type II secretory pathway pseudopilin PulG